MKEKLKLKADFPYCTRCDHTGLLPITATRPVGVEGKPYKFTQTFRCNCDMARYFFPKVEAFDEQPGTSHTDTLESQHWTCLQQWHSNKELNEFAVAGKALMGKFGVVRTFEEDLPADPPF
ncbi:MAG: hypothetical protein V3W37_03100 [Candidatus Binatia bacterium]